jgi:ribosomal protein S18 acetylase RimI-like enzyme
MSSFSIRPFRESDTNALTELWRACNLVVPQNDPAKDILRKMQVNPDWLLVGELDGELIGSCMVGYEGHRGWINYLAVHPNHQRKGLAQQLMERAEKILREVGCPKINLQVRSSNAAVIAFYESLGFSEDHVVSLGKRLQEDNA